MCGVGKPFRILYTLLVCGVTVFSGCSHDLGPAGRVYTDKSHGGASGVYIGNGYMLTNYHVAENIPDKTDMFSLSTNSYYPKSVNIPIEKVLFSNRKIELALVRLTRPVERSHAHMKICLSRTAVRNGDYLTVISSPLGYFPPERTSVVVTDDQPHMHPDYGSGMNTAKQVITIVGLIADYQAQPVAPGSSGGAVLNGKNELVGLVWGRNQLKNGGVEVWITPVSAWQDHLEKAADIADNDKSIILNTFCN